MTRTRRIRTLSLVAAAATVLASGLLAAGTASATAGPATYSLDPIDFGSVVLGAAGSPLVETVTNSGSDPLVMDTAVITTDGTHSFAIGADTCSGETVGAGDTCAITLRVRPQTLGTVTATLHVPDQSVGGGASFAMTVDSVNTAAGNFHPMQPKRVVDTRSGLDSAKAPIDGGHAIHVQIGGLAHVPTSGVSAVSVNLMATGETAAGSITAYPTGSARPSQSSLKFTTNRTVTNAATVKLGTGGKIDLYNSAGHADVALWVNGWYSASSAPVGNNNYGYSYVGVVPFRIFDSRDVDGNGLHQPLKSGFENEVGVVYDGILDSQVKALAVTITGANVHASGSVNVFSGDSAVPTRGTGVFVHADQTTANLAIVPTQSCDEDWCQGQPAGQGFSIVRVYNGTARSLDYIVDIVGLYATDDLSGGMRYHPFDTTHRIVDTRKSLGTGPFGAAGTHTVDPGLADTDTGAFAANLTVLDPSASTYLSIWPDFGDAPPGTSIAHAAAHQTVTAGTLATLGSDDGQQPIKIYNNAGHTDVLMDVTGRFEFLPGFENAITPAARAKATTTTTRAGTAAAGRRLRTVSATGSSPAARAR